MIIFPYKQKKDIMAEKMIPADGRITFVRKHDLQKISRQANQGAKDALDYLQEIMKDEAADPKLRLDAAKYLVESNIKIATEINKDQLTRMIAEAKLIGAMGQQTKTIGDETSNEKTAVIVDFSMIQNTGTTNT